MIYEVECHKTDEDGNEIGCGFIEEWNFITSAVYEERKKSYECPNCKKIGTMSNAFNKAPGVQYKGVGWTVTNMGGGNDSQSVLDRELTINDQLAGRNDDKSRKVMDDVKRAEDNSGM